LIQYEYNNLLTDSVNYTFRKRSIQGATQCMGRDMQQSNQRQGTRGNVKKCLVQT
uniref:Uncharacterized protein n=1 Tax=Ciona intestinalis TaxID=7719 RepID=H2XKG2_CIOIN